MSMRTGGQLVVDALLAQGVEVVFGIPGVHTLDIYDALLDQTAMRHIMNRHEQGCGFMADGYARSSGRVGVCIVITGPGLTNLATPLGQAYSDSSPMLVISSEIDSKLLGKGRGVLHEMKNQAAFMEQLTRWSAHAGTPAQIPQLVQRALLRHYHEHPGPVHIQIPLDVLADRCPAPIVTEPSLCVPAPSSQQTELALAMLTQAKKPILVAGGGAQSAPDGVQKLAEHLGAPVFTTALGRGVIPDDHPLAMGNTLGQEGADAFLEDCDVLLALGTSLRALASGRGFAGQLIQVNLDSADLGRNYPPALALTADVGAFLDQLLPALDAQAAPRAQMTPLPNLKSAVAPWNQGILNAIRHALGREGILAVDMTLLAYRASNGFPVYRPRTFLPPHGFGTLGFAVPAAIGARLACPTQRVIALCGDGGFMFTAEELAVAVQERLAVTVVLINSQSYEVVGRMHRGRFGRDLPVDVVNPDFQKLAGAFGIMSLRASDGDTLAYALAETADHTGPVLIEIPYRNE